MYGTLESSIIVGWCPPLYQILSLGAAHAAAVGEGRPLVAEQHAREFPGRQNPTNQQISVNSLPRLLAEISCASSSLQHTDNVVAPLDAIIKGEYRCGYC